MRKTSVLFVKHILKKTIGLVVFCMLVMTDAVAAIPNCLEESDGFCTKCEEPYVLATTSVIFPENTGQGTHCVLFCGESSENSPKNRLCTELIDETSFTKRVLYDFNVISGFDNAACYTTTSMSSCAMLIKDFCDGLDYAVCSAGYYGDGYDDDHCTLCPDSEVYFTDPELTQKADATSSQDTKTVAGCYIPSGTYYDSKGKFELTGDCSYSG